MTVINTYDKPAGQIREGNYLFGQRVLENDRKRVNCTVRLADAVDGRTAWTFKLTDMLEVGVEEKTPEEQAALDMELLQERQRSFVNLVRGWVTDAQEGIQAAEKDRTDRLSSGWDMLDHWTLDKQLTAYATYDVVRQYVTPQWLSFVDETYHVHEGEHKWEGEDHKCTVPSDVLTEYQMAVRIVESLINAVTSAAMGRRVLSRSTSLTSNLCEDLRAEALASLIKTIRYSAWGLPELEPHIHIVNSY